MIHELGSHRGKRILFGWDRHLVGEVGGYVEELKTFGDLSCVTAGDDAPHYLASAEWVCRRVLGSGGRVGVLVCATGIGVSIAANKFRGIYAARCLGVEDAELARTVNNANVLCLAARSGFELNRRILAAFMSVPYEGRRLEQLERITTLGLEAGATLHVLADATSSQTHVPEAARPRPRRVG